jgi:hypothetical protein
MARRQTQAEVNYRKGSPVGNCGICAYYQGHHRCSQVMGNISPYGISDVYRAEHNPFGKSLTAADVATIKAMMARREPNEIM